MNKSTKAFKQSSLVILAILVITFTLAGCSKPKEDAPAEEVVVVEPEIMEETIWLIDEHQINDIPLTSKAKTAAPKHESTPATTETTPSPETDSYRISTVNDLNAALVAQMNEPVDTIDIAEAIVPLDEEQTVIAYDKKGRTVGELHVISSAENDEVEQIIFTDKKHRDVYNVQVGMSGKDAKKLRKELKHMEKKGKVYLYDDQSNILYLMDANDSEGHEIAAADVDTMEVQAIIWKDKKHHKKV